MSDKDIYRIFSSKKLGKAEKQNEKQYYENYYQFNRVPQIPLAARLLEIVRVGRGTLPRAQWCLLLCFAFHTPYKCL